MTILTLTSHSKVKDACSLILTVGADKEKSVWDEWREGGLPSEIHELRWRFAGLKPTSLVGEINRTIYWFNETFISSDFQIQFM